MTMIFCPILDKQRNAKERGTFNKPIKVALLKNFFGDFQVAISGNAAA